MHGLVRSDWRRRLDPATTLRVRLKSPIRDGVIRVAVIFVFAACSRDTSSGTASAGGAQSAAATSANAANRDQGLDKLKHIFRNRLNNIGLGDVIVIAGAGIAGYNGTFTVFPISGTTIQYVNSVTGLAPSLGGTASVPAQPVFLASTQNDGRSPW